MLGNVAIPCYVLSDDRRVIVQRGMLTALDMSQGTAGRGGGDRLAKFIATNALKGFVREDLQDVINNPIRFRTTDGLIAYGYEATILADLCDAVLEARKHGKLHYQQVHIAEQCEMLVRSFAKVGIIALVDEATGYQKDRARDALARLLETFIAKELQAWVRTFQSDFYEQMFRLRGLDFPAASVKRPQYFGILTNNIVYDRLAPGVLSELKKVTPRDDTGRHKHKLFQRLTSNAGYPKLREHLGSVTSIMKLSNHWDDFMEKLDRIHPRYGTTLPLPFDDGHGI